MVIGDRLRELREAKNLMKLLIPLKEKNDKDIEFAQVTYTRGTRPPKRAEDGRLFWSVSAGNYVVRENTITHTPL